MRGVLPRHSGSTCRGAEASCRSTLGEQMINFHRRRDLAARRLHAAGARCGPAVRRPVLRVGRRPGRAPGAPRRRAGAEIEEGPVERRGRPPVDRVERVRARSRRQPARVHDLPVSRHVKPTAQELFGPRGRPRGGGGRRVRRHRRRRQDEARRDPHASRSTSPRSGSAARGGTTPIRAPRSTSARTLYSVLVQAARLDPHPRQAGRAAEVPRGDRRRVRAPGRTLRLGGRGRARATWDDDRHVWTVRLDDGTTDEGHVLISGVGFLNVPRYPDWPGLDDFEGPKFHTYASGSTSTTSPTRWSRWWARGRRPRRSFPPSNPSCATCTCSSVNRAWVMPKGDRDFSPEGALARFANPWRRRQERLRLKWLLEKTIWGGKIFRVDTTKENAAALAVLPRLHRAELRGPPRPARRGHPALPLSGQAADLRRRPSTPRSKEPNVELVPKAVASMTPTGIVDVDGVERAIDVLVMATGFQPANYLWHGPGGRRGPDRGRPSRSTGPASRTPTSGHHRPGVPQLLHPLRAGHERRRDRDDAREPVGVRGPRLRRMRRGA